MLSLRKLSGVGRKTAERFAFELLEWSSSDIDKFGEELSNIKKKLRLCAECSAVYDENICPFCDPRKRNQEKICIVSSIKYLYIIEQTKIFNGLYHVLPGLLSPIDGKGPEEIQIPQLQKRIKSLPVKEIILALDATLEGDATSLYLKDLWENSPLLVTKLAHGIPLGSSLEFVDEGTLFQALHARIPF